MIFGTTDNSSRHEAKTAEDLNKGRAGACESVSGGQWVMRIPADYVESTPPEEGVDPEEDNDDPTFPYTPYGSSRSVGLSSPVRIIRISYSQSSFIRLGPELRLNDFDDCSYLFFLNQSLA